MHRRTSFQVAGVAPMRIRIPVGIVAPVLVATLAAGLLLAIASMPVGESRPPSASLVPSQSMSGLLASSPGQGAGEATASPPASTVATTTSSPGVPSPSPHAGSPTVRPQPTRANAPTPAPGSGWALVVNDQFNAGGVPAHWGVYDGRYGSGAQNCTAPSHVLVAGGMLHLILSYEASGAGSAGCGPGWYSGGLALDGFSSIDQQVTVRFRVADSSPAISGHFIVPMRWPDSDAAWPAAGEEDYCEGDALTGCSMYLHFGSTDQQLAHAFAFDVRNWHTVRVERRSHVVRVFIDSMVAPVWTYVGTSATLPDTLKHVVLQQECQSSCPSGTSGSEDIQIDWITVANPT